MDRNNIEKYLAAFPKHRYFHVEQSSQLFTPRTGHAAANSGQHIYIFGGIEDDGTKNNAILCYDILGNSWRQLEHVGDAPAPRSGAKCVVDSSDLKNRQLVFFGGCITKDIQHCNDLFIYSTALNKWRQIDCSNQLEVPAARMDHSMVYFNQSVYVLCGKGVKQQIFNDFYKFSLKKFTWKEMKGEGQYVQPRFGHSAVVHELSMYVFGGWEVRTPPASVFA